MSREEGKPKRQVTSDCFEDLPISLEYIKKMTMAAVTPEEETLNLAPMEGQLKVLGT